MKNAEYYHPDWRKIWESLQNLSQAEVVDLLAFMETNVAKPVRENMRYGLLSRGF